MTDRSKLHVVSPKTGNIVKDDPARAGRVSVEKREALILDDLTSTRQYVNAHSQEAAEYLVATIQDPETAHPLGLAASNSILDRTIGKAAQELRIGPSEQAADIVKELSERDARTGLPPPSASATP